ncbi:hypothetical protein WN55_09250 [Dufourea novaeangliae]|uniref:Uncharacterized protein n=1 Tax=Dufourea novaeangliae TaxID=178035 RepID=A0A154P8U6_DUFNO|nr:hypothetical protein WN55_09250 [Dufourea novaeangliae]
MIVRCTTRYEYLKNSIEQRITHLRDVRRASQGEKLGSRVWDMHTVPGSSKDLRSVRSSAIPGRTVTLARYQLTGVAISGSAWQSHSKTAVMAAIVSLKACRAALLQSGGSLQNWALTLFGHRNQFHFVAGALGVYNCCLKTTEKCWKLGISRCTDQINTNSIVQTCPDDRLYGTDHYAREIHTRNHPNVSLQPLHRTLRTSNVPYRNFRFTSDKPNYLKKEGFIASGRKRSDRYGGQPDDYSSDNRERHVAAYRRVSPILRPLAFSQRRPDASREGGPSPAEDGVPASSVRQCVCDMAARRYVDIDALHHAM